MVTDSGGRITDGGWGVTEGSLTASRAVVIQTVNADILKDHAGYTERIAQRQEAQAYLCRYPDNRKLNRLDSAARPLRFRRIVPTMGMVKGISP